MNDKTEKKVANLEKIIRKVTRQQNAEARKLLHKKIHAKNRVRRFYFLKLRNSIEIILKKLEEELSLNLTTEKLSFEYSEST